MANRKPRARKRKPPEDVAILHGPTEDGEGARVLRLKHGTLYAGEVRPVREGQSIEHHELVRLRPLHEQSPVCEVEVVHDPGAADARRRGQGPARVANDSYRKNWYAVFGASKTKRARDDDWSVN
jgi:hypothetical protein